MSVVRPSVLIFACLQVQVFATSDVETGRLFYISPVKYLDEQMCHAPSVGDHSLLQSRGAISRAVGPDVSIPASDSRGVAGLVAPTQNNTEIGSGFVEVSVLDGELGVARFQHDNASSDSRANLDNREFSAGSDGFDARQYVGTSSIGTSNISIAILESSHVRGHKDAGQEASQSSESFAPASSPARDSQNQAWDFPGDRRLHVVFPHMVAKTCAQILFQTRAMATIAAGRCGVAPFTAELIAITLLIVGVLGFMMAAAVLLADIGNEKQSPVLIPRPIARSFGDSEQSHSGQNQLASTPLGGSGRAGKFIDGPRTPHLNSSLYTTPDISQRSLAPSFERREVAALQMNQTRAAPQVGPIAGATSTDDGEATIHRSAAERAARHLPQVDALRMSIQGDATLCPSLIVPAGLEFVFAIPCVLTSEMQEISFSVVDMRGHPLSHVVCHENYSHNRCRLLLETMHHTRLAEISTQKMREHPDKLPEICRPEGELFCTLVRDDSPVSCQYLLRHVNGQDLLNFRGDFRQKAVMVTSASGQLAAKSERCVAGFHGVPHYQVRVAPEVDAGLVLCGLISIDKVKSYTPPVAAPKESASPPAGLRDIVRNLQVPRIEPLVPEFRRG